MTGFSIGWNRYLQWEKLIKGQNVFMFNSAFKKIYEIFKKFLVKVKVQFLTVTENVLNVFGGRLTEEGWMLSRNDVEPGNNMRPS